ncbi:pectin acetylesterase-family hydrolase [Marinobacter nanhaiticus D15-8W]|uniref:pectin acetylesterase-family hydrolase n=1 Tax=Marinobacter nanhaiticus TaxID=1305740 RepID=UPI0002CA22B7|nr:pectin acetylesterase-family hydrolase [Marinobacter nanhaiticus]BES72909.1 pectin acetylesterase-family hydrolase [Marinobacter nanhaiticus D15-8W]
MKHSATTKITAFLAGLLLSGSALAELGDYGFWRTLGNLVSPPGADNPVTSDQRQGNYPLLSNPSGFNDGFSPGNYYAWQTIPLAPETGAVCGNGSEYKFFINRVPNTSNTIIYLEGGGACWDYESCTGQTGIRGARNPDGIPDDYMSLLNPGASLVSPFVVRLHPWTRVKTQDWNMVYIPYCTGDIYSGDKVAIYEDPDGEEESLIWHHNGMRNMRAVVAWLKDNLQRPAQMLTTGCSAGGVGGLTNYHPTRRDMEPTRGFLIDDSGPVFNAPIGASPEQYPSVLLQTFIREAWGLDRPSGPLDYIASGLPGLSLNDLGTLYAALSMALPNDRMGQTHFWQDLNFSAYSYERFYDEIANAPSETIKEAELHERWYIDTQRLQQSLAQLDNFGYYMPWFRDVNESHCTSIIEFANSDIQEAGLELDDFVANVLDGSGAVMQASETDQLADYNKPFNLLYWTLDQLL